jgi:hypothetical protein
MDVEVNPVLHPNADYTPLRAESVIPVSQ